MPKCIVCNQFRNTEIDAGVFDPVNFVYTCEKCIEEMYEHMLDKDDDDEYIGDYAYTNSNNVSKLTTALLRKHDRETSKVLTDSYGGHNVILEVLIPNEGWKHIPVDVEKVIYQAYDVNGPIYVATDGKRYHNNKTYDVKFND